MRDSPEWRQGRAGELVLLRWLQAQGYVVTPTSFIEAGGAPMILGADGAVLPDFLASLKGASRWVECKTFTAPAPWWPVKRGQGTPRWRHGIPIRSWEAYLKVEELTGIPGSLCILEKSGIVRLQELAILRDRVAQRYLGKNGKMGPEVYWYVEAFRPYELGNLPVSVEQIEWIEPKAERAKMAQPPASQQLRLMED